MSRVVESVHKVSPWRPPAVGAKNRFVVQPDDQRQSSPFILLVEDWIESDSALFGIHPHRGFETVTLILDGVERYRDHLGTEGLAHAGDVQWTCTGCGIFHGGEPEGDERLHVLQFSTNG